VLSFSQTGFSMRFRRDESRLYKQPGRLTGIVSVDIIFISKMPEYLNFLTWLD
jgi:hypothetical protein